MRASGSGFRLLLASAVLLGAGPALAQDEEDRRPFRTRIELGPQLVPSYPGSDEVSVRPFLGVARARGDDPFEFEAPDESFGLSLLRAGGFAFGPAIGFEGERDPEDVGAPLPKVDFTFEMGAFAQYQFAGPIRARVEARRGLGGHDGWIGVASLDYVARDADRWLFSVGPRLTFGDDNYHRSYFGVTPAAAVATGLPAFDPDGGLQAVGATAGFLTQLGGRWGLSTYAKYDRLVDDAGRSPVVRTLGSRDQFSGGIALSYTFGGERR
jgi:MipA family protein